MAWDLPWLKRPEPVRPPKVAGTRAPNRVLSIGFDQPHDYHVQFRGGEATVVFRRCLLVGFTTPIEDAADVPGVGENWYDRWLVLRYRDGRHVYVPRDGLITSRSRRPGHLPTSDLRSSGPGHADGVS